MSLLIEYEKIKNIIGHEKFSAIDMYLEKVNNKENIDKYFKELSKTGSTLTNYNNKIIYLKEKYNVTLLEDVIYKKSEWQKFNNWYNENMLNRKVDIKTIWDSDYDNLRCRAILSENNIQKADIVASYDGLEFEHATNEASAKIIFKSLIYDDFDNYLKLPKISTCSSLLQEIFENIYASDFAMYHITEKDWEKAYKDKYTSKDIDILKEEVEKYGLEDAITFDDCEYMTVGDDLETRFNNDRYLELDNTSEFAY